MSWGEITSYWREIQSPLFGASYVPGTDTVTFGTVRALNSVVTAYTTPGVITITQIGTPGATTVTYRLVWVAPDGTASEAGAASTTNTSNATLANRLSWAAGPSGALARVYRTVGGATQGIIYTGTALGVDDLAIAGGGETAPTVNGTGVVTAGRVLVANGTAAAPGFAFAASPSSGLYSYGTNAMALVAAGASQATWSAAGLSFGNGGDVPVTRGGAAATLQLGAANSAAPVAQTLQAQGATGTDVAGANLTIRPGAGTGAAAGSSIIFQTPTATGSGTTAQTQTTRLTLGAAADFAANVFTQTLSPRSDDLYVSGAAGARWLGVFVTRGVQGSKTKTFTNNTKTGFVTIAVPSSTIATGTIIYEIIAADATNTQAISGELKFSAAANSSGAVTAGTTADAFTPLNPATSGTLTNAITQTTGTNTLTIEFQPNSSLTATTREIRWRVNSPGTMAITPL